MYRKYHGQGKNTLKILQNLSQKLDNTFVFGPIGWLSEIAAVILPLSIMVLGRQSSNVSQQLVETQMAIIKCNEKFQVYES